MIRSGANAGLAVVLWAVGASGLGCQAESEPITLSFQPRIALSTSTVDFGTVPVGTSEIATILVENVGDRAVRLEAVRPGPAFDGAAYRVDFDVQTIQPRRSAVVQFTFTPPDARTFRAQVSVETDSAGAESVTLLGSGESSGLRVEPTQLDFGNVRLDSERTLELQVRNVSDSRMEVFLTPASAGFDRCGENPTPFCGLWDDPGLSFERAVPLEPGQRRTLRVSYQPTRAGQTAQEGFVLSHCPQRTCERRVTAVGTGVESGFVCDQDGLDLGPANPGFCVRRELTCRNDANLPVSVRTASLEPTPSRPETDEFSVQAALPVVLGPTFSDRPGSQVPVTSIEVEFCPEDEGPAWATLVLDVDEGTQTSTLSDYRIQLKARGGGPNLVAVEPFLDFGSTGLVAPYTRQVVLENRGTEPLVIDDIVFDAQATGAFGSDDARADRVPPGGRKVVDLTFSPQTVDVYRSTVVVHSNDPDTPVLEIPLRGLGVNVVSCDVDVSEPALDFATVGVGRTVSRSLLIANRSSLVPCLVHGISWASVDDQRGPFQLDSPMKGEFVPPGEARAIRIDFEAQAPGDYRAELRVALADQNQPLRTLELRAQAVVDSTLLVAPNVLDFGTVSTGCRTHRRGVTVYDRENRSFTLRDIRKLESLRDDAFEVVRTGPRSFDVFFGADEASDHGSAIWLEVEYGSGDVETVIVSLEGRTDPDAREIETFEQVGYGEVDVLFVVDDSGCMADEQVAMAVNIQAFLSFVHAQAVDYHLGVTNTELNRFLGYLRPLEEPASNRIVTRDSAPSPGEAIFPSFLLGASGGSERVLESAERALSRPLVDGHNQGFLRKDALLSIVTVTDEPEQSTTQPLDYYLSFLRSLKGFRNLDQVVVSSITGTPTGCSGPGGSAAPDSRLPALARATGGYEGSICTSDWNDLMADLAMPTVGFRHRFFLRHQPQEETLQVWVDDRRLDRRSASGVRQWWFDRSTNALEFPPLTVPEAGQKVRVEYTPRCP